MLLRLLVEAFVPHGLMVPALDDTIERRWGRRIKAHGIYRDPVRSSGSHFVETSDLRWMSLMLLSPIPWAGRVWALPFPTASLGARPSGTRSSAQDPARCLTANGLADTALAAGARPRAGRR